MKFSFSRINLEYLFEENKFTKINHALKALVFNFGLLGKQISPSIE